MDTLDVALMRQAADNVAGVARAGWMTPTLRTRLRVIAVELRGAAAMLSAEEDRRVAAR